MFEPLEKVKDSFDNVEILDQLESLVTYRDSSFLGRISSLSNASALLTWYLHDINWLGFYLVDDQFGESRLVLGPFQGAPACVTITKGKGVCGTAWQEKKTIVVADVTTFPGHIACDANSRSEVVVPLFIDDEVVGVLDVDSPTINRFTDKDVQFFQDAANIISRIYP
jgi:GAF domain-containing protein